MARPWSLEGWLARALFTAAAVCGCNKLDRTGAGAPDSAAPPPVLAATVAPTSVASVPSAQADTKRARATPAPPTMTNLVHMKVVKDECTFDFDTPETLRKVSTEGTMVTYEGQHVRLEAFSGSSLGDLALGASRHEPEDTLLYDAKSDPQVYVVRIPTADQPKLRVMAAGNENPKALRQSGLGCAFLLRGPREVEGDLLAMTRSMKMIYDEKKAK